MNRKIPYERSGFVDQNYVLCAAYHIKTNTHLTFLVLPHVGEVPVPLPTKNLIVSFGKCHGNG